MADNDKVASNRRKLYNVLSAHISNLGTFDEFNTRMDDENNRRKVYNIAQERISNMGTWDEFNARIYQAPTPVEPARPVQQVRQTTPPPTPAVEQTPVTTPATTPTPTPEVEQPETPTAEQSNAPITPKFNVGDTFTWHGKAYRLDGFREDGTARVQLDGDLTPRKMTIEQLNEAEPFTAWTPTWQQRAAYQREIDRSMQHFNANAEAGQQRLQNIIDYTKSAEGLTGQPMKGRMVYNPTTGKMEQTYITPYGDEM